jgi:CRISPR-associated protein (TIGR03984 family)
MTTKTIVLHARASEDDVALRQVLSVYPLFSDGKLPTALVYTPSHCFVAVLNDGRLWRTRGREVPLDQVFEARVFSCRAELRWLHRSNGDGGAVLLSEDPDCLSECGNTLTEDVSLTALETVKHTYLLWGKGVNVETDGWSLLTEARIGKLWVPLTGLGDGRAHLSAVEYLAEYDGSGTVVGNGRPAGMENRHGNVGVAEERLLTLEVAG